MVIQRFPRWINLRNKFYQVEMRKIHLPKIINVNLLWDRNVESAGPFVPGSWFTQIPQNPLRSLIRIRIDIIPKRYRCSIHPSTPTRLPRILVISLWPRWKEAPESSGQKRNGRKRVARITGILSKRGFNPTRTRLLRTFSNSVSKLPTRRPTFLSAKIERERKY